MGEGLIEERGTKIRHKSLKSRPGAGKRKEKLVALERERFARNMAVMAQGTTKGEGGAGEGTMGRRQGEEGDDVLKNKGGGDGEGPAYSSKERWAAIRRFIEQTMERKEPER